MKKMSKDRKSIWGWAIYDWANSAFATTVMAGFFPVFFKKYWSIGADVNQSTAMLGFGNSLASLFVALMAPFLGAIADKGALKKKFLIFFAYLGVLMTAGLYLVEKGDWLMAVFVYVLGVIGFSGSNIFYDSLLPSITNEENVDSVSSFGYAMGYLGGGILFSLNVIMTLQPKYFGLADASEAVRWSFLSVAIWWALFSIFTITWVNEPEIENNKKLASNVVEGIKQLLKTFKEIRHLKTVLIFLLAYWFYIDGVDTIVKMAVDYGISLGFDSNDLILALLIVQFVGFPSALVFGYLGGKWGVKKSIFLAISIYIGITLWGMMMREKYEFYVLAVVIGLVQGGIQALSRSYYSKIIPKNKSAEYFGFYNMLGKFAAIIGPALIGIVGLWARRILMPESPTKEQMLEVGMLASRWSIGSVVLLFVVGAIFLFFVDEEKGREEAIYLSRK